MEEQYETYQKIEEPKKKKGFMTPLLAGIIGSVLTLSLTPYMGQVSDLMALEKKNEAPLVMEETKESSLPIQQINYPSSNLADMIESASQAIVGVVTIQERNPFYSASSQPTESGSGSGVIFKKTETDAYIVTNYHVIESAKEIEISLMDGEKTSAQVVGIDPLMDLAVLKIDASLAPATLSFGDSSVLRPGDSVVAIGNPLGMELSRTVTQGIVSATNRTIPVTTSQGQWELPVLQTDAAINPGNSGGALLNTQGELIGINSLKIMNSGVEGLGFAIPSEDVMPIVEEIIEKGKVARPYLGVQLVNLEEVPLPYRPHLPQELTQGLSLFKLKKIP
ncbi:S1C family serine protease [Caldalkalibacillus mannanilyticus]|uniref:S1C family serine protease n=1 Tax=Caldalkalibacillus mannanilyticus TaxID=1418 RepID=UPI000A451F79|nr:trypsin-like peptidase domain-containing protein [Caldalkalibacillus mannanilyticus]